MSLSALTHPEDESRTLEQLKALYAGQVPVLNLEKRYLRADGAVVWSHVAIELVRNDDDAPVYTYIQVLDVTARVLAEAALRRSERTWRMTVEHAPHAIAVVGLDGAFLHVNEALVRMLGYNKTELLSTTFQAITHPDDLDADVGLVAALVSGDITSYMLNKRYLHSDGREVWTKLSVALVRDDSGAPQHFVSQIEDITEHRRRAEELRGSDERFRLAFELAPVGMMLTDLSERSRGSLLRVNQALCRMLGYSTEELLRRSVSDITHPEDRVADRGFLGALQTSGCPSTASYENRYLRADGSTVWVMVHSGTVCDEAGHPEYSVTQVQEITVMRAERQRLADLALQDALTGVGNRALLNDRLELAVERTARRGSTLAVLYCDLDRFKPINDRYGHAAGDLVLQAVAGRIRTAIRPTDTIARIGGDEFVVLCEDLDHKEQAEVIRQRVLTEVAGPLAVAAGIEVEVRVSVGLQAGSGPGLDAQELLHRADLAMYKSKKASRNPVPTTDAIPLPTDQLRSLPGSPGAQEQARLAALDRYRVLGTDSEGTYDDLAELAGQVCGTPMAAIGFVAGHGAWLKARWGMGSSPPARDATLWGHALRSSALMEVSDTYLDPRFAVGAPPSDWARIRFFASAPLVTSDCHVLGALTVLDVVPRRLDENSRQLLTALAAQVMGAWRAAGRLHAERLGRRSGLAAGARATLLDPSASTRPLPAHRNATHRPAPASVVSGQRSAVTSAARPEVSPCHWCSTTRRSRSSTVPGSPAATRTSASAIRTSRMLCCCDARTSSSNPSSGVALR